MQEPVTDFNYVDSVLGNPPQSPDVAPGGAMSFANISPPTSLLSLTTHQSPSYQHQPTHVF